MVSIIKEKVRAGAFIASEFPGSVGGPCFDSVKLTAGESYAAGTILSIDNTTNYWVAWDPTDLTRETVDGILWSSVDLTGSAAAYVDVTAFVRGPVYVDDSDGRLTYPDGTDAAMWAGLKALNIHKKTLV